MLENCLSISPSRICDFYRWNGERRRSDMPSISLNNLADNKHKGKMSKNATKRMSNAIDWLLAYATDKKVFSPKYGKKFNFLIGFVTLTLSSKQIHSDKEIKKKLLHQFLTECRWRWGVIHFVWKAERQKNGNIHFHIVTDKFIPYKELRDCWNRIQNKLGYVSRFAEHNNHCDPNSTDIHSVASIKNVALYIKKYMAKHEDEEQIEGNIWGLSYSLSKSKPLIISVENEVQKHFNYLKEMFLNQWKELEYCGLLFVNFRDYISQKKNIIVGQFLEHVSYWRDYWCSGQFSIKVS